MVVLLDYCEYLEMGGKLSEDAFPNYERKAEKYLHYVTFNRLHELRPWIEDGTYIVPMEVKEVLVEFIDKLANIDAQRMNGANISSYSNGIEKIEYTAQSDASIRKDFSKLAIEWLPDYLVNRSVKFDVKQYLQSISNNPK